MGGTLVLLATGAVKAIEDIQLGDEVAATNPDSGTTANREVTNVITGNGEKHLVQVTVDVDGDKGDQTASVTATANHPIWVKNRHSWVDAGYLEAGDRVREEDGTTAEVVGLKAWTEVERVYNLTVHGVHTYYVMAGAAPILVHKTSCGDEFDDLRDKTAKYREENGLPVAGSKADTRTVAAFEYTTPGGRSRTIVIENIPRNTPGTPAGLHAEIRINRILADRGIDPLRVTRIYADRGFCPIYANSQKKYSNAILGHS